MQTGISLDLCRHLNTYPIGAPVSDEIIEILRLKFIPEEARLVFFLHLIPRTTVVWLFGPVFYSENTVVYS